MKKLISSLLFISTLFLTGCFGFLSSEKNLEESLEPSNNNFQAENFSLNVPEEWEKIEKSNFTAEIPAGTAIVFRNNVKNENFTANVNVSQNSLKTPLSSADYAKQAISNLKASMFDFDEKRRETIKIRIGNSEMETLYLAFEGKRNENEDMVQFLQIYGVKEHIGYIVTGAFSSDEEEIIVQKIDEIVRSFEIK